MAKITKDFERTHDNLTLTKPIDQTYIWAVLESEEEFLEEAEEAGLVNGEDYFIDRGIIYSQEIDLISLGEHLILKNNQQKRIQEEAIEGRS